VFETEWSTTREYAREKKGNVTPNFLGDVPHGEHEGWFKYCDFAPVLKPELPNGPPRSSVRTVLSSFENARFAKFGRDLAGALRSELVR
jgi:hypothetical protein